MKDFDIWNQKKQTIEKGIPNELVFHEREIWWCSIGINIGDEQDGKHDLFERPVLVLKKFNKKVAWVLPMTTQLKEGIYYYPLIHNKEVSMVILSQLRIVSVKRFCRFIRRISPNQFQIIRSKIKSLL